MAPWSRCCRGVLAAGHLALVAVPQALGEEARVRNISSALVCGDQDAADEVMRALHDPDAEIVVRRLVVMVTSEGCREAFGGQNYDAERVEPSGVLEVRLRRTTGYVVPLAPTDP